MKPCNLFARFAPFSSNLLAGVVSFTNPRLVGLDEWGLLGGKELLKLSQETCFSVAPSSLTLVLFRSRIRRVGRSVWSVYGARWRREVETCRRRFLACSRLCGLRTLYICRRRVLLEAHSSMGTGISNEGRWRGGPSVSKYNLSSWWSPVTRLLVWSIQVKLVSSFCCDYESTCGGMGSVRVAGWKRTLAIASRNLFFRIICLLDEAL